MSQTLQPTLGWSEQNINIYSMHSIDIHPVYLTPFLIADLASIAMIVKNQSSYESHDANAPNGIAANGILIKRVISEITRSRKFLWITFAFVLFGFINSCASFSLYNPLLFAWSSFHFPVLLRSFHALHCHLSTSERTIKCVLYEWAQGGVMWMGPPSLSSLPECRDPPARILVEVLRISIEILSFFGIFSNFHKPLSP